MKPVRRNIIYFFNKLHYTCSSRAMGPGRNPRQFKMEKYFIAIILCSTWIIAFANADAAANDNSTVQLFNLAAAAGLAGTYGKILAKLAAPKEIGPSEILNEIRMVQSNMTQLEHLLKFQFDDLLSTLNSMSLLNDVKNVQDRFNRYSSYINYQYEKMTLGIDSENGDVIESVTLQDFAKQSTGQGDRHLPNYLREFIELIVPRVGSSQGLLNLYSKYVMKQDHKYEWCNNGQSLNDFIYKSYRFAMQTIMRGHLVILESYAIRRAFNEGNFTAEMAFTKREYERAARSVTDNLQKLASEGSTKLRRCDPPVHKRGETYLELEKLFQGILVNKLTLNPQHTGKYECEEYRDAGAGYYPYDGIRSDGDWKCHGYMYNCYHSYAFDICHPTTPNRRFDGFTAENTRAGFFHPWEPVPNNMGNLTNCKDKKFWTYLDWDRPSYWGIYLLGPCACICDDIRHPKSLRRFSKEAVMSDYHNNMVITGIRLANIDNVIHIEIQQGKLDVFGYIDPATVHWKARSSSVNKSNGSQSEPIILSNRNKGINLDALHAERDQVLIGVKFDLDDPNGNLLLSAIAVDFTFASGQLDTEQTHRIFYDSTRTTVELDKPNIPTLCPKNIPVEGDHKLVKFQASDWLKDAAQTTVPFIDIQEVVTNPPSILRGVGLRYKDGPGCGGFVGFELYSHDYIDLISYDLLE